MLTLGGGERERIFWKNYFVHCAFTRYEAGLSIDEIWSGEPDVGFQASNNASALGIHDVKEEETIVFNDHSHDAVVDGSKAFPSEPETDANAPFSKAEDKDDSSGGNRSEIASYEMVQERNADPEDDEPIDYELDELEAEIARELEN
jgi:hypothetical protein